MIYQESRLILKDLRAEIKERQKIDPSLLAGEIIGLLKDKSLYTLERFKDHTKKLLTVPSQFSVDCIRTDSISYNGTIVSSLKNNKAVIEKMKERLGFPLEQEIKNKELIVKYLVSKLNKPLFNKIATIVNQTHSSDLVVKLGLALNMKIIERGSTITFKPSAVKQEYELLHDPKKIVIIAKIIFSSSIVAAGDSIPRPLGFFGFRRETSVLTKELVDFNTETDVSIPSLEVKEKVTDLYKNNSKKVEKIVNSKILE